MEPMSKMRKLGSSPAQETQEENNVDRISDLPESLLHHIFSFLDMKQTVQTSTLSRRWRFFWTSLPSLKFEFMRGNGSLQSRTRDHFMHFVNRVLLLRDHSIIMQKFSLVYVEDNDISTHFESWMLGAVKSNVQEVYIDINCNRMMCAFPTSLFTCKSLTKLEWENTSPLQILVPYSVSLPSLKTLNLSSHVFPDEKRTNQMLSSCPELESLIIWNCDFLRINLSISSNKLKHLTLGSCYTSQDVKVKTVNICAPNLVSFRCHDYIMLKYYSHEDLSSLVKADIYAYEERKFKYPDLPPVKKNMYAQSVLKFLRCLHRVEDLTLSPQLIQVLSGPFGLSRTPITRLCNLKCLKLKTVLSIDYIRAIPCVLQASSNLESVSVHIIEAYTMEVMSTIWDKDIFLNDPTQMCNLRCLKLEIRPTIHCIQAMGYLLHTIPVESIFVQLKRYQDRDPIWDETSLDEENTLYSWEAQVVFKCMNRLKVVEIRNIVGCLDELEFIKILLKSAVVLENLIIIFISKLGTVMGWPERRQRNASFCEKLHTFSRASPSCKFVMKNIE